MRILHVWSQAGVSSILAKYQNRLGHFSEVIKRKGYDPYDIDKYYETTIYEGSSIGFYQYAKKRSKEFDIIHIHSQVKTLGFIDRKAHTVLHFHGSDIRNRGFSGSIQNWLAKRLANKVLVSTPDLLSAIPKAEWLPTPIDTEMFNSKVKQQKQTPPIKYENLPSHLRSLGIHEQNKVWALSKLSLEALACGVPIKWNGLIIDCELPDIHKPENVAKRTIEIYEKLLSNGD